MRELIAGGHAASPVVVPVSLRSAGLSSSSGVGLPLPALPLRPASSREPAQLGRATDTAANLRVLIVEDDPPVRHACTEIATGLGYLGPFCGGAPWMFFCWI